MPKYSKSSKSELSTCHPDIQTLFKEVIRFYDNTIIDGHRDKPTQDKAYEEGRSQLEWPKSKHNKVPSEAADSGPYIKGRGIPWPNVQALKRIESFVDEEHIFQPLQRYIKDLCTWYLYIGFVIGTAKQLKERGVIRHDIRSGSDWDMDFDLLDQKFDDLPHYEIVKGG